VTFDSFVGWKKWKKEELAKEAVNEAEEAVCTAGCSECRPLPG
jgi:hypothetical protein